MGKSANLEDLTEVLESWTFTSYNGSEGIEMEATSSRQLYELIGRSMTIWQGESMVGWGVVAHAKLFEIDEMDIVNEAWQVCGRVYVECC